MRLGSALVAAFLICLSPVGARSQTPPVVKQETDQKTKQAEESFKKGTELFNQEKYVGALEEFKKSYDLSPKTSVLYNIGICHYFLFQFGGAIEMLKKYLAEAKKADPEKRKKVEDLIKEMEGESSKLIVVTEPADATVVIDGKVVVATPMKDHVFLSPGEHVIEVKKEGYGAKSQSVMLTEGAVKKMEVTIDKLLPGKDAGVKTVTVKVEEAGSKEAIVAVICGDAGALASVDGGQKQKTPAEFRLAPGKHSVIVEAEGKVPKVKEVTAEAGQKVMLEVTLNAQAIAVAGKEGPTAEVPKKEKKKKKPFYKTAWFWSVIGVVVASGAGVGIYFGVTQGSGGPDPILEVHPK